MLGYSELYCIFCHLTNVLRYSIWLILCHRGNLLQSIRLCLFGKDHLLCQWTCRTLPVVACHSEWYVECLHFSANFFLSTFFFQHITNFGDYLNCSRVQPLFNFLFLMWLSLQMLHLIIWAFYFQGSGFPLSSSGSWSGSMYKVHITLQEFQAVALMLHKMAFHLSGKVAALHLDNSTSKAYLCNQGGTAHPFLFSLAWHILNLTDKYGITLVPACIPTHFNVEDIMWKVGSRVVPLFLHSSVSVSILGQPEVHLLVSLCTRQCQHY